MADMDEWVKAGAAKIAERAERELEALVAVSSPSGDVRGAEESLALCTALLPSQAELERAPCSSAGFAPDLIATMRGTGSGRLALLGHVDTVVSHEAHRPVERHGERLVGSGGVDMKGGVVLAMGAMRALAGAPERFSEVALLLVNDEEWRTEPFAHTERFAGFDACLCFEAGERAGEGGQGVVVRRKAAATLRVEARGLAAHSGSAPDRGRNALLALAATAEQVATHHDPSGPQRLSAVPTVLSSGDAFNVVPAYGELFCDLRADTLEAFDPVLEAVPAEVGGAQLTGALVRRWPGMDAREATEDLLAAAGELAGVQVIGVERGGASDASHLASSIPITVDGLGPYGGGAHTPDEFVARDSLGQRAAVALAVIAAALDSV